MKTMGAGLVGVVLLVNLAAADCAWLMWTETISPVHRGQPCEIYSSYASYEACLTALKAQRREAERHTSAITEHVGAFTARSHDRLTTVTAICLPDRVDPRPQAVKSD